jgi:hypothetical protein
MRVSTWRILLTGGALTILTVAGIGFVAAAGTPAAPAANVALAEPTVAPDASSRPERPFSSARPDGVRPDGERLGHRGARLLRLGRHLVHAEVTITGRDGDLIHLQLDHGTVHSIGGGSLTIVEEGGATETVSTDDATKVSIGREQGSLADVAAGVEVFVQSRIEGATVLAKRIVVISAKS